MPSRQETVVQRCAGCFPLVGGVNNTASPCTIANVGFDMGPKHDGERHNIHFGQVMDRLFVAPYGLCDNERSLWSRVGQPSQCTQLVRGCLGPAVMEPFGQGTPKLHLMVHLILRSAVLGNPWHYACWSDEAENRTLKRVLRNVSQLAFESLGLQKLEHVLSRGSKRSHGSG